MKKLILCLIAFNITFFNCFAKANQNDEDLQRFFFELEEKLIRVEKQGQKGEIVDLASLGSWYLYEDKPNLEKAIYWLTKAVEQEESPLIQTELGKAYLRLETKDIEKGVYWLNEAAEQGYGKAMGILGFYYLGNAAESKVNQNFDKAIKWLVLAADRGVDNAHEKLRELESIDRSKLIKGKKLAKIWYKEHPHLICR